MVIDTGECVMPQRALLAWLVENGEHDGYGEAWWVELTLDDGNGVEGWLVHYDAPGDLVGDAITLAAVPDDHDPNGRARDQYSPELWAAEGLPGVTVLVEDLSQVVIP